MQDRPTKEELLAMVESFLRTDVLALTEGRVRFHLLVAMNLLSIVQKELELEEEQLAAEGRGLAELLAEPAPPAEAGGRELDRHVLHGNERLCGEIQAGAFADPERRTALYSHLRAALEDKLAAANPRLLSLLKSEG
jgi:hypothetical protein